MVTNGAANRKRYMTEQEARDAVKKLIAADIESEVYENYSGRGMYGRETTGVVVRSAWKTSSAMETCSVLKEMARDGLGMGTIFY